MADFLRMLRDALIAALIFNFFVLWTKASLSDGVVSVTINETYYQIRLGKAAEKWNDWRIKPGKPLIVEPVR